MKKIGLRNAVKFPGVFLRLTYLNKRYPLYHWIGYLTLLYNEKDPTEVTGFLIKDLYDPDLVIGEEYIGYFEIHINNKTEYITPNCRLLYSAYKNTEGNRSTGLLLNYTSSSTDYLQDLIVDMDHYLGYCIYATSP